MMDGFDFDAVLEDIALPSGKPTLGCDGVDRFYLQIVGPRGRGRKWWLSSHMTPSEVVRTAFAAGLAFEEHELREGFTYKGARIFSPHISVEALAEVCNNEDRRRDSPGAWERE